MEQTSLSLGTVGQRLEAARHEKGVTVSEAGESTRILPKVIESMEADDFASLAAPVYVKGFIRLYAQYLGLDPIPLVNEYAGTQTPKGRPQLADDTKMILATVDAGAEADAMPSTVGKRKKVFGDVHEQSSSGGGSAFPVRSIGIGAGLVLVLLLIVFSVKQCDSDSPEVPAEAVAPTSATREALFQDVPNVYIIKPGVVELEQ